MSLRHKIISHKLIVLLGILMSLTILRVSAGEIHIPLYLINYESLEPVKQQEENITPEGWMAFDLRSKEDLKELEKLCKTSKVPIQVNDYIAESHIGDLATMFDVIDAFYYNLPLLYSKVEAIYQPSEIGEMEDKIKAKYNEISQIPFGDYIELRDGIQVQQSTYTLVTPIPAQENQYVEYKLNEETIGTSTRYPYVYEVDEGLLNPGMNQIRVIVYNQDKKPQAKDFYIDIEKEEEYAKREERKDEVYPLSSKPQSETIPVLMYHKFLNEVPDDERSIAVSVDLFEEQLHTLIEEGYTTISFNQLKLYLDGKGGLPEKPIIITSDDGYLCNYVEAYPLLKKYNAKATFFVSTSHVGQMQFQEHFSWDQAKEMEQSGLIDIQSHSHRHIPIDSMDKQQVQYEADTSFAEIQKHLGERDVKVLAYPQFRHNKNTQKWLKESGVDLQVTKLVKKPKSTTSMQVQRIHVSEDTSSKDLMQEITRITK